MRKKTVTNNIEVQNIQKYFGKRHVLKGINLAINTSEIVGLLGTNGSGKTTLFYIIAGLLYPDDGKVLLNGEDIKDYPMYQRARMGMGYLPQDTSIFRGLNVEDNIESILEIYYHNKEERKHKLSELLQDFDISHIRKSPAMALSGGERRRVEIARTLASNPSFILLDEPFAGVDPIAVAELRSLIQGLKQRGIGILITDHNVIETLNVVDEAYILYDGKILFSGHKDEVMNNPEVRRTYLGNSFQ